MLEKLEHKTDKTLIKNVNLLDVRKGEIRKGVNVFAAGGVIADTDSGPKRDADCDVIDGGGCTMIPGLINCHAHILSPYLSTQEGMPGPWAFRQIYRNLEATLAAGVVCVRDLLAVIHVMNRMKARIESGRVPGPDIVAAGPVLSCAGGYPEFITPVYFPLSALVGQPKMHLKSPGKAAAMVRHIHKCGAEVAKVGYTSITRDFLDKRDMPVISDEIFDAITRTAHELGMTVAVHHNWACDLPKILRANIDSLEHVVFDRELDDGEIALIKESGAAVVPTLTVTDSMARLEEKKGFLRSERAREYFEPQALEHLNWVADTWLNFDGEKYDSSFGYWRANRLHYSISQTNTARMHEAGVPICAGTDLGAVVAWPGELADEIIRLHQIGLSRLEAIQSATINAAKLVGREKQLGAVEAGKRSDIALIEGDPLEDLRALKKVRLVGKGGNWFRPAHNEVPDFWPGFQVEFTYDETKDILKKLNRL